MQNMRTIQREPRVSITETAYERVTRELSRVTQWSPPGEKGDWRCPAHNDGTASLSVSRGDKGVVLKCQAGCETKDVIERLGLAMGDLFDQPTARRTERPEIVATYDYTDETGDLLFQVVRMTPKTFRQRRRGPAGEWQWSISDTRRVLYRLPRVIEAVQRGHTVFVVEGEKDVHAIEAAGATATCNSGGAGKWRDEYSRALAGADVVIVADKDGPGRQHAHIVCASLQAAGCTVTITEALTGKDAADHLGAGHPLEELRIYEPASPAAEADPQPDLAHLSEEQQLLRVTVTLAAARAHTTGGTFILDAPQRIEAVWGEGDNVAWALGEPLMINGPTGVGKTTIAQQVVLGRLGIRTEVLGLPVTPTTNRVLYIAADRPKQAARSFRRMVTEEHRATLDERLEVWRGPLPTELAKNPDLLLVLADYYGADTIVVDSLKDVVAKLSDDESANRANNAFQACSANDIEIVVLHHQRKAQADNKKPNGISDVFGSTWLTAGMGSVLLVWGQPGDPIVEVSHLKQPADPIGPLTVRHDHTIGLSVVEAGVDLYDLIRTSKGLTAEGAARGLWKKDEPTRNDTEKARRQIQKLIDKGIVVGQDGGRSATGKQQSIRYYAVGNEPT